MEFSAMRTKTVLPGIIMSTLLLKLVHLREFLLLIPALHSMDADPTFLLFHHMPPCNRF